MKRALVIGASEEAEFAIKTAQRRGYYVVAIDGNPNAKGLTFADQSIIADITDENRLKECIGDYEPQIVLPVPIGRYLTSTGVINDYFGLKGVSKRSAALCTDKFAFHQALHQNNLRDGDCLLLQAGICTQDAIKMCNEYLKTSDYENAILKPRFGSGSRGVVMMSVDRDAGEYFDSSSALDEDMILEPAYPGIEYGVDGIVCDGTLSIVLLREKIISAAPYRQAIAYIANHVSEEKRTVAQRYLQSVANVLEFKNCIIHCDLMWTGSDFKVIEISARPSGHNLHNLFVPIVTGVNMIDRFIDISEGRNMELVYPAKNKEVFLIGYYDYREGNLLSVPSADAVFKEFGAEVIDCKIDLKPGFVEHATEGHTLMSRGRFVICGSSHEDVLNTRNRVLSYVFKDFEEK